LHLALPMPGTLSLACSGLLGAALAGPWEQRAWSAGGLALLLVMLFGPRVIRALGRLAREPLKCPSPDVACLQRQKQGTPTLGGLLVLAALLAAAAVAVEWREPRAALVLLAACGLGGVGLTDDLVKLRSSARGLAPRAKLAAQAAVVVPVAAGLAVVRAAEPAGSALWPAGGSVPFWLWVGWAAVWILGWTNAVNLTDGLDGLAAGCYLPAALALAALAHSFGRPRGGEVAVVLAAAAGAVLGFLWFNCHPAAVFLGNTGALALGGLWGAAALAVGLELAAVVIGGVFLVEAGSVVAQVASFRWRRRRVLLCAPLHHHWQLAGWTEPRIVVRFWIAAGVCAALGWAWTNSRTHEAPPWPTSSLARQVSP
jgi:phospho-N-acetylmuramoyl-pentapeptide-transferase